MGSVKQRSKIRILYDTLIAIRSGFCTRGVLLYKVGVTGANFYRYLDNWVDAGILTKHKNTKELKKQLNLDKGTRADIYLLTSRGKSVIFLLEQLAENIGWENI